MPPSTSNQHIALCLLQKLLSKGCHRKWGRTFVHPRKSLWITESEISYTILPVSIPPSASIFSAKYVKHLLVVKLLIIRILVTVCAYLQGLAVSVLQRTKDFWTTLWQNFGHSYFLFQYDKVRNTKGMVWGVDDLNLNAIRHLWYKLEQWLGVRLSCPTSLPKCINALKKERKKENSHRNTYKQ